MQKQKTINKEVVFEGVGVHSGLMSKVLLKPSGVNSGIVIKNFNFSKQEIKVGEVIPEVSLYATILKNENFKVSTIEHLMAAINALNIDNIIVEIDGVETPIMDGSSLPFVHKILEVGFNEQNAKKQFLTPKNKLEFKDEKDGRVIVINPAEAKQGKYDLSLYIDYLAEFDNPIVGSGKIDCILTPDFFVKEIAPARTFGFLNQLPMMQKLGLAKGASLDNTVVIGESGYLNPRRFEDEFVRHKLLDMVGDLALLGKKLTGKVVAKKTGHNFNRLVVEHYINNRNAWMIIE